MEVPPIIDRQGIANSIFDKYLIFKADMYVIVGITGGYGSPDNAPVDEADNDKYGVLV